MLVKFGTNPCTLLCLIIPPRTLEVSHLSVNHDTKLLSWGKQVLTTLQFLTAIID